MLEGGDRRGLRRVDAWEEETRAGRGEGLSGEGGLPGEEGLRRTEGWAAGTRVSSLKTLGSRCGAWQSRWPAGRGPCTGDRPGRLG